MWGRGAGCRCLSRRSCEPGRKPPSPRRSRSPPVRRHRPHSPANSPLAVPLVACCPSACQRKSDCCNRKKENEKEIFMPTLYLTEDYSLVRRDSEDTLLVQIPEKRAKDGVPPAPARKEHIPL